MPKDVNRLALTNRIVDLFLGDGPETRLSSVTLDELSKRLFGSSTAAYRKATVKGCKRAMAKLALDHGITVLSLTWGGVQDKAKLLPSPTDDATAITKSEAKSFSIRETRRRRPTEVAAYIVANQDNERAVIVALARSQGFVKSAAGSYIRQVKGAASGGALPGVSAAAEVSRLSPLLPSNEA